MPTLEPELSVVVATRNRRPLLMRCLDSLCAQDADPDSFEVLVADDGSTDGTADAVDRLVTPFRLRCLKLPKQGQAAAQNAAIEAAEGSLVLFLDDDVVAAPALVAGHLAAHRERAGLLGVGHLEQRPPARRDWYAQMFARTWNRHYSELGTRSLDWTACFGANLSASRAALIAVGGFATDIPVGEDMELAFRLEREGLTAGFVPEARAVHDDEKHWRRLLEDSGRQGGGQVELAQRHPAMAAKLLGWFLATSRREVALRRVAIALRIPPAALAMAGRLLPDRGRREVWFHFVARCAFWRGVRSRVDRDRWLQLTRGVPVLMYHAFSRRDEGSRYVVPQRAFARQMWLLRLMRFRVMALEDLVEALAAGDLPPPRAAAITIDDGYADNLEVAFPILRRHGFPATIYLVSERLGGVNEWTRSGQLGRRRILSAGQLQELAAGGIRFGAHTRTHPELPQEPDERVSDEIEGSRRDLEAVVGPVATFAYPYGLLDGRAVAAVREAGFLGACTVEPRLVRPSDDPLLLPRVEVRSGDSLLTVALHLWLGAS